jgi:hypothetical protein
MEETTEEVSEETTESMEETTTEQPVTEEETTEAEVESTTLAEKPLPPDDADLEEAPEIDTTASEEEVTETVATTKIITDTNQVATEKADESAEGRGTDSHILTQTIATTTESSEYAPVTVQMPTTIDITAFTNQFTSTTPGSNSIPETSKNGTTTFSNCLKMPCRNGGTCVTTSEGAKVRNQDENCAPTTLPVKFCPTVCVQFRPSRTHV